jgi:hypothetical protein
MKRTRSSGLCVALLATGALAAPVLAAPSAARTLAGRWQGVAQIPGAPAVIVLDLDQAAGASWSGSVTVPGYGAKGVPLAEVACKDGTLTASAAVFGGAKIRAQAAGDKLAGTLEAGGNTAPLELERIGAAQVDLPPRNEALAAGFEGAWQSEFELGWKQRAELALRNEPGGTSSGEMKIGGAPVKLVRIVQDGAFLQFRVGNTGLAFEGRLDPAGSAIEGRLYVAGLEGLVRWERSTKPTTEPKPEASK